VQTSVASCPAISAFVLKSEPYDAPSTRMLVFAVITSPSRLGINTAREELALRSVSDEGFDAS
jgi:hypothetical protein